MKADPKILLSMAVIMAIVVINIAPNVFSHYFNQLQQVMLGGGLLGFYLLMVVQSIVAAIPAEVVLVMGGSAFGLGASSSVGTLGLMSGALMNYAIGLRFGRPLMERLIGRGQLERVERLFVEHGPKIIFAARFIPWISFDAVSYFAGAVGIAPRYFAIATLLGTVPRAIFYSYIGERVGTSVGKGDVTLLNYLLLATFLAIVSLAIASHRGASRKPPEGA